MCSCALCEDLWEKSVPSRGIRRHSSLTCFRKDNTGVKKVLPAKSQRRGTIGTCMAACSPGCQICPQAGTGLWGERQKLPLSYQSRTKLCSVFPSAKSFKSNFSIHVEKLSPYARHGCTHTISAWEPLYVPFSGGTGLAWPSTMPLELLTVTLP